MSNYSLREEYLVKDEADLRSGYGRVYEGIFRKSADYLSDPMLRFIALSPFCCISSQDASGATDISPRGDGPGFVKVLDNRTLFIPDRPGNWRFDTMRNIFENPRVSLLFIIPGVFDTVRVNGVAHVTRDPDLCEACAMKGRIPDLGLIIVVEEAFGHCSKAIRRAGLWDSESHVDRDIVPTLRELMSAHQDLPTEEVEAIETRIVKDLQNNMY